MRNALRFALIGLLVAATFIGLTGTGQAADKAKKPAGEKPKPIAIATVKHKGPVSFEKEIRPILSKKCLSCHNTTTHESQLILESPAAILKGGESGPAIVAKNGAGSLLLQAASHQVEPIMPPEDNDVGALPLTPEELGLVKLWIDEGGLAGVAAASVAVKWQPLPPGINPIYAVAMTDDGQWGACGRANQIFLYHLASGRTITRMTDPALLKAGLRGWHRPFGPGPLAGLQPRRRLARLRRFPRNQTVAPAAENAQVRPGRIDRAGHCAGRQPRWKMVGHRF